MEISKTNGRYFSASEQEQIETALDATGADYELDGHATTYDIHVTTQEQMRTVLATVEALSDKLTVSI